LQRRGFGPEGVLGQGLQQVDLGGAPVAGFVFEELAQFVDDDEQARAARRVDGGLQLGDPFDDQADARSLGGGLGQPGQHPRGASGQSGEIALGRPVQRPQQASPERFGAARQGHDAKALGVGQAPSISLGEIRRALFQHRAGVAVGAAAALAEQLAEKQPEGGFAGAVGADQGPGAGRFAGVQGIGDAAEHLHGPAGEDVRAKVVLGFAVALDVDGAGIAGVDSNAMGQ
jgi:hypothetical protein